MKAWEQETQHEAIGLLRLAQKGRVCDDLELLSSLSDGPLALLELLGCLWTRLPDHDVLQLHIQLLLFLDGEKREGDPTDDGEEE